MASQDSHKRDTRFDVRPAHHGSHQERGSFHESSSEDLPVSASNRTVGITLAIGVALMILIILLPYLNSD